MTDLNKEREAFEAYIDTKLPTQRKMHTFTYDAQENKYEIAKWVLDDVCVLRFLNDSWEVWQARAKSQAVPDTHLLIPKEPRHDTIIAIASVCLGPAGSEAEFLNLDEAKDVYKALVASESGAEG